LFICQEKPGDIGSIGNCKVVFLVSQSTFPVVKKQDDGDDYQQQC
jgi:hypothetical protein